LQRLRASKPLDNALSSSKRLMRILRPVVEAATDLVAVGIADLFVAAQYEQNPSVTIFPGRPYLFMIRLRNFSAAALSRFAVTTASKNLPFVIDSAPEIAELAVDLHKHLIQMPPPLRIAAPVRDSLLSDLGSEQRAKPVPPKPDRLMANVDPALGQKILDCATTEGTLRTSSRPDGSLLASC
jgi:hypothetical protein